MSLGRYAKKRDASEAAIISALRKVGAQVVPCDTFDLAVYFRGTVHLLECKTGKEPLTATQERLIAEGWPLRIVRTPEEGLRAIGAMS